MFGAAAALDAAQRGCAPALIERADFAGATSSHSFKMVHGGIRYLQHADLPRLRHSARARSAFLRSAPHLVRPLPIVVPTYGKGMKSKPVLRVGLGAYDLLTADRNRGISDPTRRIPRGVFLSGEETRRRYPGLAQQGLTGAGIFCDGQMYNPPRLVLAYVQSAAALGAVCANYVEATGLIERGGRVQGVLARDAAGDGRIEIRSRFVLNAAGPYAEWILADSLGRGLTPPTPFSRDAYFIVRRPLIEGDHALTVPAITTDRDAIVSRGGRHLFLVPWRGATLVGVWHKVHQGHPDTYEITQPELEGWIAEVNGAYGGLDLTLGGRGPGQCRPRALWRKRPERHRAQVRPSLPARRSPCRAGPRRTADADRGALHDRPGRGCGGHLHGRPAARSKAAAVPRRVVARPWRQLPRLRDAGGRSAPNGTGGCVAGERSGAGP